MNKLMRFLLRDGSKEHCFEIPSAAIAEVLWQRDTLPKILREADELRAAPLS